VYIVGMHRVALSAVSIKIGDVVASIEPWRICLYSTDNSSVVCLSDERIYETFQLKIFMRICL